MATRTSADVGFFLVGGRNLLGSTASLTDKITDGTVETTPLGVAFPEHTATGLSTAVLTQDGYFDDSTGGAHEALSVNSSQVLCYGLSGNVAGRVFRGFSGSFVADYERIVKIGDVHRAKATYTITGNHEEGTIVVALAARTTAGNTDVTGTDNLTAAASGGAGYLQVGALTLGGSTNLIVKVRHSADNITFADGITFAAVTAAYSAQRVVTASAIDRYLAISWVWIGAGSGQTATLMVGFSRA